MIALQQEATMLQTLGRALRAALRRAFPNDSQWAARTHFSEWLMGYDEPTVRDPYTQNGTVYAAIATLARNTATPPPVVMAGDRKQPKPLEGHPVTTLLRRPNPMMDRFAFTELAVLFHESRGAVFIVSPGRDPMGYPTEAWPLNPDQFSAVVRGGQLIGWKQQDQGAETIWAPHEVCLIRYPDPQRPFGWLAPWKAAMLDLETDRAAALYNRSFFRNGAVPGGMLELDENLAKAEFDSLKQRFQDSFGGPNNAHRYQLLQGGIKWVPAAVSQREAEFLGGRQFADERALMVHNVPHECVGLGKKTFENVDAAWANLWVHNLNPRLVRYAEALTWHWIWPTDGDRAWLDFDRSDITYLQEDLTEKLDQGLKLQALGWTMHQINDRLRLEMPKVAWGDDPPPTLQLLAEPEDEDEDDFAREDGREEIEDEEPPKKLKPGKEEEDDEEEGQKRLPMPDPVAVVQTALVPGDIDTCTRGLSLTRRASIRKLDKRGRRMEGQVRKRVADHFYRLRTEVLRSISSNAERLGSKARALEPPARRSLLDDLLFNMGEAKRALKTSLRTVLLKVAFTGASSAREDLGLPTSGWVPPEAIFAVHRSRLNFIVTVDETVGDDIRRHLGDLIREGAGPTEMASKVRERFNVHRTGALRIARTEVQGTLNEARVEQYREEKVERHEWLTALDDVVRESHQIHGTVRKMGKEFPNGLRHPGDQDGPPGEIINCRCRTVAVEEGEAEDEDDQ